MFHVWLLEGALGLLCLTAATRVLHARRTALVSALAGLLLIGTGVSLLCLRCEQVDKYNQAMTALDQHDLPQVIKLLDESSAAYKSDQERNQLQRLLFGAPHTAVEALAHFHKGNALIMADPKKGNEAAEQYWLSLRCNAGNRYTGLTSEVADVRYGDALQAKANLEKLYAQGEANGQAKGKGGGPGKAPSQPQPGDDPSSQPGHKSRETL